MVRAGVFGSFFLLTQLSCCLQKRCGEPSLLSPPARHSRFTFFSQLQRFKRSLSLKTILRSKSVENFFLRSGSELKCPTEVLLTPPTPLPPPSPPPASTDRGLPTPTPSPCPVPRPLAPLKPVRLHSFQEHVFKRASPCELCHQLIVGRYLPGWALKQAGGHLGISHGTAWHRSTSMQGHTTRCASLPGETHECWVGASFGS